ncbi:MAG: SUMF1/EgtB/PvdO family nonheme iron enzyme [Planctomycetota bacterium]|nr:SUMF1/EgtB/PvdO family nonheme iron enzyme [Planctomycetota bacterium]
MPERESITHLLQAGGTLVPGRHVYIERPEDAQVLKLLLDREYCNILSCRQMGKSSLMAHVADQLDREGVLVAQVDLQDMGTPESLDDWYQGLLRDIVRALRVQVDVKQWWSDSDETTSNQRLQAFFRDAVAPHVNQPIVIVVDEIDQTLKLPYTDDFFAAIRSMYNQRGKTPEFASITFCLVGVASPHELIKDTRTTPYNVGRTIELRDFNAQRDDMSALRNAVNRDDAGLGDAIVQGVLRWTDGQPYLTAILCNRFAAETDLDATRAAAAIDNWVEREFVGHDAIPEDDKAHFQRITEYLTDRADDPTSTLNLYRSIRRGKAEPDLATQRHNDLKLSGIVKRNGKGELIVRNRLYERIFTPDWASATMPPVERRLAKRVIDKWRKKLEFLQGEEATASDPAQKFTLRKQIEEAQQKIAELEAVNPPPSDPPTGTTRPSKKPGKSHRPERKASQTSTNPLVADLCEMIERRQLVLFVGSGVSLATNDKSLSWRGLIESGIRQCRAIGAPEQWYQAVASQIQLTSFPDMLLAAAELVHNRLSENGGGELARWLRVTFEPLEPENHAVIHALAALDLPLLTTNYDDLIEKATSLKYITWKEARHVARFVRGDDRRVLHLHGHWDQPESVVLGIRSYEAVKHSVHTQAVMQALAMTNSLLFVGCGEEGMSDPNFANFLSWLEAVETAAGVEHRHYRLVRRQDAFEPRGRLFPIVYGDSYDDLPEFLAMLKPPAPDEDQAAADQQVSRALSASLPASIGNYLTCLADETSHLTLLGMGRSLQVELPIDEAFIPLRTTLARSLEQRETERFKEGHAEFEKDVELAEVFREASQFGQHGVILLGEPGSGKTTGARQLAWRLSSRQSLPQDLGLPAGIVPVLLRFRNLSSAMLAMKRGGLKAFLLAETYHENAPDGLDSPGNDLWNWQPGLLWILDGLDEVIDPQARQQVSRWVQRAIGQRPQDRFLVTCRFQGYFRAGVPLGPKFVEFHVRPLTDQQVQQFVREWFAAAYAKLLGPGERAKARALDDSGALLRILAQDEYQSGHIRELCTNPLLLTILCIVFHEERKLPTGRAELYAHCVRVLLEYWRRDLYVAEGGTSAKAYDAEAAQAVLAGVAWWMHGQQDRTSAPLAELAEQAAKHLAQVSPSSRLGTSGEEFLQRMRDEAGILAMTGEGEGRCGFLHLSFQEYLAAEHAAREGLAKELASVAAESWWREVALLSLRRSRPFCEAFFREMLASGIAENHPDLAERCLQEALYFVPGPFVDVLNKSRASSRVAAVLRLLRDRAEQVPELEAISRRLAESKDQATRGFAREILAGQGVELAVEPQEGDVFVDQSTGITFVWIPPGEFQMGSNHGLDWEKPIHTVKITRGVWLGKYPVTNAEYDRFLKSSGKSVKKPEYWDDRRFNQGEQPVVGVSWEEAAAFCQWAGGRLPTEAEWEYACRAGTTTEYSFGKDEKLLEEHGWFEKNSGGQTQPVGAKKPNPWGLYDMHGNVWEWCADWFDEGYYAKSPTEDPTGPQSGSDRVNRGGCWLFSAGSCRSAYRDWNTPADRYNYLGFRLALVPSSQAPEGGEARSGGP